MTTVTDTPRARAPFAWILLATLVSVLLFAGCTIPERIVPIEPGTPVDKYGLPISPERAAYGYSNCRRPSR